MPFVHLQTHTEYSMLRASARIDDLLKNAAAQGQTAIALTDHGNMFGVLEFYMSAKNLAKKKGIEIKPILGCHVYIDDESSTPREENTYHRAVLLAETDQGYRNLVKIVSWRYEQPDRWSEISSVSLEVLKTYSEGLIALTGDLYSKLGSDVSTGRLTGAENYLDEMGKIFDRDHLYLTLQDHGIAEEKTLNRFLKDYAQKNNTQLVVTNNAHYVKEEDALGHKVLQCIAKAEQLRTYVSKGFPTEQYYLKSEAEMAALFPDDAEALENSGKIAERCNVKIRTNVKDEFWPQFQPPEGFEDADAYMRHVTYEFLPKRFAAPDQRVIDRVETELAIIKQMKVASYLLIVWDFINWCRNQGIPVGPGRGSAAGSLVTYIVGITDIDPLRFDLLFERFLNPERVSMPDIDTDFSDKERHLVIKYVSEKYGHECVTQIITYGSMKAKGVIRDVGRALGVPIPEVNAIAKTIPADLGMTLQKAWDDSEDLRNLIESRDTYKELWKLCISLEGLVRQSGVHAAAVIIAPVHMSDLAPLYRAAPEDTPVIQYDKHYAEDIGLLKMDFLGLRNLSVIQDALALIKETHNGFELDIGKVEFDDAKTFELLGKGLTVGVFQFESGGMQQYLRQLKPNRIEDLIAMNALYRPGPMEQIPRYIKCKLGEEKVNCYHDDLSQVLGETYGVIVYQEQVMRIAQIIAGFSLGGADNLRRAMAKKDPTKMAEIEVDFIAKGVERGYSQKLVKDLWDVMLPFCGYAFNKSHAAAYAYVAYQTAFLKANYGPEYMAANMTSETSSTENIVTLVQECRKMGVPVHHPDINQSEVYFSVKDGAILYGLAGVKNVGIAIMEDLVAERKANGPFTTLFDLCKRALDYQASQPEKRPPLNKKTLESLIMAGGLDHLKGSRAEQHASIDKAIEVASRYRKDKDAGQMSLFDMGGGSPAMTTEENLEQVEPWTYLEMLNKERDVLGLYLSGHPLEAYRAELKGFTTCSLAESEINAQTLKSTITVGGIITKIRTLQSKDGTKTFGAGAVQDFAGDIELFFKADLWEKVRDRISMDMMLLVRGKVELTRDEKGRQLIVERVFPIEDAKTRLAKFIHIQTSTSGLTEKALRELDELFQLYPAFPGMDGGCDIVFHLETGTGYIHDLHARKYKVQCESELIERLAHNFGSDQVWIASKLK
jgi:DNA polymerase III subunit alpha